MITDLFINFSYIVINTIVNFFPISSGFGSEVATAFSSLGGYLGVWSPILPISTLATCVSLVLGIELSIFGFKSFKWIFSHIPWIGGKGN